MSFCCYTLCCSYGVTACQTIKNYELKLYHKLHQRVTFPLCAAAVLSSRELYEVQVYCRQLVSSTPESLADVKKLACKISVIYFLYPLNQRLHVYSTKLHLLLLLFLCISHFFSLLNSPLGMNVTNPLEFLNDFVNDSFSNLRIIGHSYSIYI